MTRKHFKLIAALILEYRGLIKNPRILPEHAIAGLAWDLCDIFKACNPRFQHRRFLKACGFTDEEINESEAERKVA